MKSCTLENYSAKPKFTYVTKWTPSRLLTHEDDKDVGLVNPLKTFQQAVSLVAIRSRGLSFTFVCRSYGSSVPLAVGLVSCSHKQKDGTLMFYRSCY